MNNSAAGALQASFGVIRSSRISSRCVVWGPTDERIHTVVTRFFWRVLSFDNENSILYGGLGACGSLSPNLAAQVRGRFSGRLAPDEADQH
jgi:hypothetical protein